MVQSELTERLERSEKVPLSHYNDLSNVIGQKTRECKLYYFAHIPTVENGNLYACKMNLTTILAISVFMCMHM